MSPLGEPGQDQVDALGGELGEQLGQGRLVPLSIGGVVAERPGPGPVPLEIHIQHRDRVPAELERRAQPLVPGEDRPVPKREQGPSPQHRRVRDHRLLERLEPLATDPPRVVWPGPKQGHRDRGHGAENAAGLPPRPTHRWPSDQLEGRRDQPPFAATSRRSRSRCSFSAWRAGATTASPNQPVTCAPAMTMALPDRRRPPRPKNSAQPPPSTPISALCSNRICSQARRIHAPTGALCTHGVHQVRSPDPPLQPDRLPFGRSDHVRGRPLFIGSAG